jgi:hypothetical protein
MQTRNADVSAALATEAARSRAIARRDEGALSRIYAEDFRGIADGATLSKPQVLRILSHGDAGYRFSKLDLCAMPFGPHRVIVTFHLIGTPTSTGLRRIDERIAHIYVFRDGRWQTSHAISIPASNLAR